MGTASTQRKARLPLIESPPGRHFMAVALRRVLRSKWLWIVLLVVVMLLGAYQRLRIVIADLPATLPGETLVITGRNFRAEQGTGYVLHRQQGEPVDVFNSVVSWSDTRIEVRLPDDVASGGHVQVIQTSYLWEWPSNAYPLVVPESELPSEPYGYEVPAAPDSPWPSFRRDRRNTGRSPLPAVYHGDHPWAFKTGKGIFSTPVIGGDDTIYVGSADHYFYAVAPNGVPKWRFKTGELIDSAAVLHAPDRETGIPAVTFGSGDGKLYHLRIDDGIGNVRDRVLWTFDSAQHPGEGYNNWFEGSVQLGFDGAIYAGNTNWNYYALHPDGGLRWILPTGNNNWSVAAIANDGAIFWGSCDGRVHAVAPDGEPRWSKQTIGFIASSAAIGSDGTVYIGSFDSHLYAFAPDSPWPKWRFKTGDHVYTSPALGERAGGETDAIYFASTDGHCYALAPDGSLRWKHDTGAPVRSSPALGAGPDGAPGAIVYFGCGNGRLYALNTEDGSRRWSFDTTRLSRELRERNDLNGSPALGHTGIYIGGEHGYLCYVPYDYCIERDDKSWRSWINAHRCETDPGEAWPDDQTALYYVNAAGNTLREDPHTLPAAPLLAFRLVVREDGETREARIDSDTVEVSADPPFPFTWEPSAAGDYLYIIPEDFLKTGTDYTVRIEGAYRVDPWYIGNLDFGGRQAGRFEKTLRFHVSPPSQPRLPLTAGEGRAPALEFTRLAVPIPTMMPSLNQIGFDYIEQIQGLVDMDPPGEDGTGRFVLWTIGARYDGEGNLVPDQVQKGGVESEFSYAYNGRYRGNDFMACASDVTLSVTGFDVPIEHLELRGRLMPNGRVRAGAHIYGYSSALRIPTYGPLLIMAGLVSNVWERLLVMGTYVTRDYAARGDANAHPEEIAVQQVDYRAPTHEAPGHVIVTFERASGASFPITAHRAGIVLLRAGRAEAVQLDYNKLLRSTHDGRGNLAMVSLTLPRGAALPQNLRAAVMLDAYPLDIVPLASTRHAGE